MTTTPDPAAHTTIRDPHRPVPPTEEGGIPFLKIGLAIVAVLIVVFGSVWLMSGDNAPATQQAKATPATTPVATPPPVAPATTPDPATSPTPAPTPAPADTPEVAALKAQITELQAKLATPAATTPATVAPATTAPADPLLARIAALETAAKTGGALVNVSVSQSQAQAQAQAQAPQRKNK